MENASYCDSNGNCLPPVLGTYIPVLICVGSSLSCLSSMLDCLQPESFTEKLETSCFAWSNLMVRLLTIVLSLSYLSWFWTALFVTIVLIVDALHLNLSSIPARFSGLSSWLLSLTTSTLLVENISAQERGRGTARDDEEKEKINRSLGLQSLLNLALFSGHTTIFTILVATNMVNTNSNNILSDHQLFPIFIYFFLPLTAINLLSSLLLIFLPAFSPDKLLKALSSVLNLLLLIATMVLPLISVIYFIPHSPRDVFVLAKVRDSLSIYTATINSDISLEVAAAWTYDVETESLRNEKTELSLGRRNRSLAERLSLSVELTEHDMRDVMEVAGKGDSSSI